MRHTLCTVLERYKPGQTGCDSHSEHLAAALDQPPKARSWTPDRWYVFVSSCSSVCGAYKRIIATHECITLTCARVASSDESTGSQLLLLPSRVHMVGREPLSKSARSQLAAPRRFPRRAEKSHSPWMSQSGAGGRVARRLFLAYRPSTRYLSYDKGKGWPPEGDGQPLCPLVATSTDYDAMRRRRARQKPIAPTAAKTIEAGSGVGFTLPDACVRRANGPVEPDTFSPCR